MIQEWRSPDGEVIEVGDKIDVAKILGISPRTWSSYVLRGSPEQFNRPPTPVGVDPKTRRDLWDLAAVREWHARRPGRGDHRGAGAAKRWGKRPWGKES